MKHRARTFPSRIMGGVIALTLATCVGLALASCGMEAEDCRNTATCPPPVYCVEAGDAMDEVDGCF
jgi:hypothetical protein